MCGITGLFSPRQSISHETLTSLAKKMTQCIAHRGPDADGHYIDTSNGLALGHRRLSIRDLSPTGAQPMFTPEQKQCIVYNGEIYNAEELREDLQSRGIDFYGTSDTEVVLKGCAYYGVESFVPRMIGMFGLAYWDSTTQTLTVVRDRLGIKPIYYTCINDVWGFASELKSLYYHPHWQGEINRDVAAQFLHLSYIHAPHSIFKNTYKLPAGAMLHISSKGEGKVHTYWDAKEKMLHGQSNQLQGSDAECIESTHNILKDAVKRRMIADVPLGAFLSGGIDSSLVVALMQSQSMDKIRTFSIGFEEDFCNEAPYAKAVAKHLGTDHTEHYMSAKDAWDVIPKVASMYDEPFADSSQLPTYLLSAMTRKDVTVALSGDGGDELFAGYGRYFTLNQSPESSSPIWKLAHTLFNNTPRPALDTLAKFLPERYKHNFADRIQRRIELHYIPPEEYLTLYKHITLCHWVKPEEVVLGATRPKDIIDDHAFLTKFTTRFSQMQAADTLSYLTDDILVKVDRASMASSLEVRVPILDHRVFEHAWKLPMHLKAEGNVGKIALRKILAQYIPTELFERPKMGFGVPLGEWLRGPLQDWVESLLDEKKLREQGLLDAQLVRKVWQAHLGGESREYLIWDVLMLQEFMQKNTNRVE